MEKTMIQLNKSTMLKLKSMKKYSRQSYDEVINELIDDVEVEVLTEQDISELKEGLEDIKAGRIFTMVELAKELGVKLKK